MYVTYIFKVFDTWKSQHVIRLFRTEILPRSKLEFLHVSEMQYFQAKPLTVNKIFIQDKPLTENKIFIQDRYSSIKQYLISVNSDAMVYILARKQQLKAILKKSLKNHLINLYMHNFLCEGGIIHSLMMKNDRPSFAQNWDQYLRFTLNKNW